MDGDETFRMRQKSHDINHDMGSGILWGIMEKALCNLVRLWSRSDSVRNGYLMGMDGDLMGNGW
jgi:hypothetical protein